MTLTKIRKRDGRLAEFNEEKIARAIEKAFNATYKPGRGEEARKLADEVLSILEVEGQAQPDVEHIQDLVERVLMDNGYVQTAKSYIIFFCRSNGIVKICVVAVEIKCFFIIRIFW